MHFKLKVAVAAVAALLLAGVSVTAALATSPQKVALLLSDEMGSGYSASYGQEIDLLPTVLSSIELPGDKFTFQAYVADSDGVMKWLPISDWEPITLEDTNTVPPFGFRMGYDGIVSLSDFSDRALTYPVDIRCLYQPAGKDTTPTPSFSESETVDVIKYSSERVTFSTIGTVKAAGTRFKFHVTPVAGIGTIKVTIKKPGAATRTYNVTTDADGNASSTLKLGITKGAYAVSAKFLGNQWGDASGTAVKRVLATR
jgi:hypothetical protein